MRQKLLLPLETFSINQVHCRDTRYVTADFKTWSCNVLRHIASNNNQKAINYIRENFDSNKHYLAVDIISYYPREKMFTMADSISSRIHDVSNIEKPLIDVIFLSKYHGKNSIYKGPNFNIDDKYIKKMSSMQLVGDDHLIEIYVEIRGLAELDTLF